MLEKPFLKKTLAINNRRIQSLNKRRNEWTHQPAFRVIALILSLKLKLMLQQTNLQLPKKKQYSIHLEVARLVSLRGV